MEKSKDWVLTLIPSSGIPGRDLDSHLSGHLLGTSIYGVLAMTKQSTRDLILWLSLGRRRMFRRVAVSWRLER